MYNLRATEDSSVDITHQWFGGACFFKLHKSHDELGSSNFEIVLDDNEIEDLIDYLTHALNTKA